MHRNLLASDRVMLLLSLVPYLREHGPTTIDDLADTFEVKPALLRRLIGFLGTAGIPGETLAYQHDDLFDIDWDAFLEDDTVSLTQTVAIDDTPRFTGTETAALLAGLHALESSLSDDDAAIARNLASRLGAALDVGASPAVSIVGDAGDGRVTTLIEAIEHRRTVTFAYRSADGKRAIRAVDPTDLVERLGTWYLQGFSHEREAERTFRIDQMSDLTIGDEFDVRAPSDAVRATIHTIRALVPERLLAALKGFAPTIMDAGAQTPEGIVRIEIEAWHAGAAVRLVQHAPGEIVIEAPQAARQAVSDWAERALAGMGEASIQGTLG